MIVVVGISHRTAPLEIRERLTVPKDAAPGFLARLLSLEPVGEALVLSTCNRTEVYAAPRQGSGEADLDAAARAVASMLASLGGDAVASHLVQKTGDDALLHLFRVAASLDSLVVGEPQILGQLKEAIEVARGARSIGPLLTRALDSAVRVGKRVRTETQIGAGQVSVASIAVDLARQIFGDLGGRRALLVGAGEMAEAAARLVARAGADLTIVNRSLERAEALAAELGGASRGMHELEKSLRESDVVVTSTSSPTHIVGVDLVKRVLRARKGRSIFFVDIAVPRDVDPAVNEIDNVYVYDVDDLSRVVAESRSGRAAEADEAERLAAEEVRVFSAWASTRAVKPTIVALRERTRAVLASELDRSLSGKLRHLGPGEREALGAMLDAVTNKLLHGPTARLRALAEDPARLAEHVEAIRHVFDLPPDTGPDRREEPEPEPARAAAAPQAAPLSATPADAPLP